MQSDLLETLRENFISICINRFPHKYWSLYIIEMLLQLGNSVYIHRCTTDIMTSCSMHVNGSPSLTLQRMWAVIRLSRVVADKRRPVEVLWAIRNSSPPRCWGNVGNVWPMFLEGWHIEQCTKYIEQCTSKNPGLTLESLRASTTTFRGALFFKDTTEWMTQELHVPLGLFSASHWSATGYFRP